MDDDLNKVFKALADPTRRAILDMLRGGPRQTTQIVQAFPDLSRFGMMKHLDVLKRCRLVVARKQGRHRYNSLNAVPIRRLYERWVSRYEDHWASSLLRVKEHAEDAERTQGGPRPGTTESQ